MPDRIRLDGRVAVVTGAAGVIGTATMRLLAERGRVREAIAEFERVLRSDPSSVQAHYNLGALYGDAGANTRNFER